MTMKSLVDKLAVAGWIESSRIIDRKGKSFVSEIKWTPGGLKLLHEFVSISRQIEHASKSKLTGEELHLLKGLADSEELKQGS